MSSFRDQLGEDWLRYQHHLDGEETTIVRTDGSNQTASQTLSSSNGLPVDPSPVKIPEVLPQPLLSLETKDKDLETESTLHWLSHSTQQTESTLEGSVVDGLAVRQDEASSPHSSPDSQTSVRALSETTNQEEDEGLGGKLFR